MPMQSMLIPANADNTIILTKSPLRIGRRETCDVILEYRKLSGVHAELIFESATWKIRDVRSRNGIKVNGIRLRSGTLHELCNGDEIELADLPFIFVTK